MTERFVDPVRLGMSRPVFELYIMKADRRCCVGTQDRPLLCSDEEAGRDCDERLMSTQR